MTHVLATFMSGSASQHSRSVKGLEFPRPPPSPLSSFPQRAVPPCLKPLLMGEVGIYVDNVCIEDLGQYIS